MKPRTVVQMKQFLEEDLFNELRWVCVGAVAWKVHKKLDPFPNLDVFGMDSSFVHARSLYEFYYQKNPRPPKKGNTAWVGNFTDKSWQPAKTNSYKKFIAEDSPVQKRVFHLAYGRSEYGEVRNEVLAFARDLCRLTEAFVDHAELDYRDSVKSALDRARNEANIVVNRYGIDNPIWDENGQVKP